MVKLAMKGKAYRDVERENFKGPGGYEKVRQWIVLTYLGTAMEESGEKLHNVTTIRRKHGEDIRSFCINFEKCVEEAADASLTMPPS